MKKQQMKLNDIVEKAKREAEGVIHDLRKMQHEKHAEVKEHELIDAQKRLTEAAPKEIKIKTSGRKTKAKSMFSQPGDEVKVLKF